jgi:hypothetical protein
VYTVCTVCTSTLHSVQTVQFVSVQYTVYTSVYNVQCVLCTVQCTQCTVYIVHITTWLWPIPTHYTATEAHCDKIISLNIRAMNLKNSERQEKLNSNTHSKHNATPRTRRYCYLAVHHEIFFCYMWMPQYWLKWIFPCCLLCSYHSTSISKHYQSSLLLLLASVFTCNLRKWSWTFNGDNSVLRLQITTSADSLCTEPFLNSNYSH